MSTSPVVCSDQQGRMLDPAHQAHLEVFFWVKNSKKETLARKNSSKHRFEQDSETHIPPKNLRFLKEQVLLYLSPVCLPKK